MKERLSSVRIACHRCYNTVTTSDLVPAKRACQTREKRHSSTHDPANADPPARPTSSLGRPPSNRLQVRTIDPARASTSPGRGDLSRDFSVSRRPLARQDGNLSRSDKRGPLLSTRARPAGPAAREIGAAARHGMSSHPLLDERERAFPFLDANLISRVPSFSLTAPSTDDVR